MRFIFTIFFIPIYIFTFAQKNEYSIEFAPTFNNLPVELNKYYGFQNDSIKISTLKFYVANISFYENNRLVETVSKKYHLIDLENPETTSIKIVRTNSKASNSISLNIGIDSLTNVAGALGEDLDPTKGMYWTWQSGYINLKLEGQSKICPSRNNLFNFHIGGYQYPYNSIQKLNFFIKDSKRIVFHLDISKLLNGVQLNEVYEIMSPGKKALNFAQLFANSINVME
jgi:hypothetical protein